MIVPLDTFEIDPVENNEEWKIRFMQRHELGYK
jgi:hypothetical protein